MDPRTAFQERCLSFSAGILKLADQLPQTKATRIISDQFLRSGTSVGANVQEARAAESRADFVHKMQIALKEARETGYWLALMERANVLCDPALKPLSQEAREIAAIIAQSVITAKQNGQIKE